MKSNICAGKRRKVVPTVTFVLYRKFPICCEGNDIPGEAKELKIWMSDSPNLRSQAEGVAMELIAEHGGHAQVWDIV